MRRAAVLLAAASFVMALPAAASDATAAKSLTITDVPPKTLIRFEYTKGDTIRGTELLRNAVRQFNKPKGAAVGTDRYVILAVAYQKISVDFVVRFPGGTVHAHGEGKPGSGEVPIVGGTGRYAGATGMAGGRHLADSRKLNVYRLQIP